MNYMYSNSGDDSVVNQDPLESSINKQDSVGAIVEPTNSGTEVLKDCPVAVIVQNQSPTFVHPFYAKLVITQEQIGEYQAFVQSTTSRVLEAFSDLFLAIYSMSEGKLQGEARNIIAKFILEKGVVQVKQKVDFVSFNKKESNTNSVLALTFNTIISTGGLLACLLIHPSYFVSNPLETLKNLTLAMLEIEQVLTKHLSANFSQQVDQAARDQLEEQDLSMDPKGPRFQEARKRVLAATAFELFSTAVQYGLAVTNRMEFRVELNLLPHVTIQSNTLRALINPVLEKRKLSLRILARVLNPQILVTAYQNRIAGYLAPKLQHFLTSNVTPERRAYEEAFMVEIHKSSPFIIPRLKKALESHQKLINKYKGNT